jgi:hypothetical protein
MIVKVNGERIEDKVDRIEVRTEVPDYVAWFVIALGILAVKGWVTLCQTSTLVQYINVWVN